MGGGGGGVGTTEEAEHERRRRRRRRSSGGSGGDGGGLEAEGGAYGINDNEDLLAEILGRLDGRSLGVAACVCRRWRALCRGDALWERLCVRQAGCGVGAEARAVVLALGGYRRLYWACVGPVLDRKRSRTGAAAWITRDEAQLSLSLFSIDCYERLGGKRSSLMFLCPPAR